MTSPTPSLQPPRIAAWLVILFSPAAGGESIPGDMLEEFHHLGSQHGAVFARRWYRREALRTIPHLFAAAFRSAPWMVTAVVLGAFLLRWLMSMLSTPAINTAIDSLLTKYLVYEDDPKAYLFWLTTTTLVSRFVLNALVGLLTAAVARDREMTATILLALLGIALAIEAIVSAVVNSGDYGVIRTLPHTVVFSAAIVAAGMLVRTWRWRRSLA